MCSRNSKWYWRERKRVLDTFYVKWNFVMNANCDCSKHICEAIITITFPGKQTLMKHDMKKFKLTQFECRIQNPINLLVNRKKLDKFFPTSFILNITNQSCHHFSVIFFNDVYFFLWTAILSIYLLPADIWEEWSPHWQFDTLQANPTTD